MGEFWAGKTQNTTRFLKKYQPTNEINISNYYTGYTQFELSSVNDIINIFNDIYDYHQFVNYEGFFEKLFKLKPEKLKDEFFEKKVIFDEKYWKNLIKWLKFNIVLDESSIYFNPRNFKTNFWWKNEDLLNFVFQLRKLNVLFFCIVQSPYEIDVRFRRLATYYRKYYHWLWFYRWYKDFYFLNPEEVDLEMAQEVWWWVFRWWSFNFYPYYPKYDYFSYELIKPWLDIYKKGDLLKYISELSKNNITPWDSLPILDKYKTLKNLEENKENNNISTIISKS